jgi:hypothetical protein
MSCENVQRLLHEELDPGRPDPALQAHLATCVECQGVRDKLMAMREAMLQLPLPALPDSFELTLRREIKREVASLDAGSRRKRRWSPLVLSAAAALLLAASGVLLWVASSSQPGDVVGAQHALRLSVNTAQEHPEASFDVELPEGVRLADEVHVALGTADDQLHLRWRSHLRRGLNTIELPLVVTRPGVRVRARLKASGQSIQRSLKLARLHQRPVTLAGVLTACASLIATPAHADPSLELGVSSRRVIKGEASAIVARLRAAVVSQASAEHLAVIQPDLETASEELPRVSGSTPSSPTGGVTDPDDQPLDQPALSKRSQRRRRAMRHKAAAKGAPATKGAATSARPLDISRRLLDEASRLSKTEPAQGSGAKSGASVASQVRTRGRTRLHALPGAGRRAGKGSKTASGARGAGKGAIGAGQGSGKGSGSGSGSGMGAGAGAGSAPGSGAGGGSGAGASKPGSSVGVSKPGSGTGASAKPGSGTGKSSGGQPRRGR